MQVDHDSLLANFNEWNEPRVNRFKDLLNQRKEIQAKIDELCRIPHGFVTAWEKLESPVSQLISSEAVYVGPSVEVDEGYRKFQVRTGDRVFIANIHAINKDGDVCGLLYQIDLPAHLEVKDQVAVKLNASICFPLKSGKMPKNPHTFSVPFTDLRFNFDK